ncbi:DUF3899 domain-containing protein [Thermoactinomyces mirandus]|uniref:DUF3899 domain-containing protein n=1 Tax=Thermoactinomyces mirandus TaxID=2756294 RepID=A0A7W1XT55_9BACL|nr:DUF3899 domain-containing protein [Thermoactinomyces mirandus]MBA4602754.1 DUF3899 domain-containing protein [Thermoactinomyces mirandus]
MSRYAYPIITLLIFSLLLTGFTSNDQLASFINHSFLTGLLFLIIGAITHVIKSGVFSMFIKSFKKINRLPGSHPDEEPDPVLKEERDHFYHLVQVTFLSTGLILSFISVASLLFM